jgi:hypothetical protein
LYPNGLAFGDEFECARINWASKNSFELVQAADPGRAQAPPMPVRDPVTLTPAQFAALPFSEARQYALGLYGIKARSKAELLREYTEARG